MGAIGNMIVEAGSKQKFTLSSGIIEGFDVGVLTEALGVDFNRISIEVILKRGGKKLPIVKSTLGNVTLISAWGYNTSSLAAYQRPILLSATPDQYMTAGYIRFEPIDLRNGVLEVIIDYEKTALTGAYSNLRFNTLFIVPIRTNRSEFRLSTIRDAYIDIDANSFNLSGADFKQVISTGGNALALDLEKEDHSYLHSVSMVVDGLRRTMNFKEAALNKYFTDFVDLGCSPYVHGTHRHLNSFAKKVSMEIFFNKEYIAQAQTYVVWEKLL